MTFSGIATFLFILYSVIIPFSGLGLDPYFLLAGPVSLVLIIIAFALNLRNGSFVAGMAMTSMGTLSILFAIHTWMKYFLEDSAYANDPDFVYNTSGYDEYLTLVLAVSSVILSMGLYSLLKRLSKPTKIEKKSPL